MSLPRTAQIVHAPHFRMADPRTQGVAGIIRFIGGMTGAMDPHCADLGVWEGMTERERITNHVSDRDMEAIAETYDCKSSLGR